MPNLQKFMSGIAKNGFQKSNWFDFRISQMPPALNANSKTPIQEWLSTGFICTAVSLPGRGFATADQSIYGFQRKVPYFSEFQPLTCTFVMPIDSYGLDVGPRFFNNWMNAIQRVTQNRGKRDSVDVNYSGAFDMSFPNTYYAEAEIRQYSFLDTGSDNLLLQNLTDINGKPLKDIDGKPMAASEMKQVSLRYRFAELYPASVEAIPLNWADTDSFTQLSVTFNYSYWTDTTDELTADESAWSSSASSLLDYGLGPAPQARLENQFDPNAFLAESPIGVQPPKEPSMWSKIFNGAKQLALDEARFRGWIQ